MISRVRTQFQTSSDITIVADIWGQESDKTVILAHGGGQTRHAWGGTATTLAQAGWQAISIDMRGHGESSWATNGDYAMESFAQDLIYIAEHFKNPTIVGASLGGLAAITAQALSKNKAFSALVLVDVVPNLSQHGANNILAFMSSNLEQGFASLEEAADAIAAYLPHRKRPKNLDGLKKNLRLGEDGRYRWHWDPNFILDKNKDRPRGKPEYREKLVNSAKQINIPTLLVRGKMSELVTEAAAKEFLQIVPHAQYVDVQDAAHMVAGDKNDIFTQAVTEFLQQVDI